MNIQIGKLNSRDIASTVELLKALYLELGEEAGSVAFLNDSFVCGLLDTGLTELYVARSAEHAIVGLVTLTKCQSLYAGGSYGLLDEMYVLPAFRSAGVGRRLVDAVLALVKERSWKRVDVTAPTEERWKRTVGFYESCGFTFTGPKLKFQIG